jgi:hypothetical protein
VVFIAAWNTFLPVDLEHVKDIMKEARVVNLRNIYRPMEMHALGLDYQSVALR